MADPTRRFHLPSALRRTTLRIEPETARALVAGGALLVDVRRKDDRAPTIAGASRIPPDEIPRTLATLPRDTPIVLACT